MSIEFINATYSYQKDKVFERLAFSNVTLKLKKGEMLLITGESGAGKSSVLKAMNANLIPQSGLLQIYGQDVQQLSKAQLSKIRRQIGMLQQFPEKQLFERQVFDDIAFALRCEGVKQEELLEERVKNAMQSVDLNFWELKNRSPFDLSQGQKKKVALAGILVKSIDFLLLDEPLSGLDYSSRRALQRNIWGLKKQGLGIAVVSHELEPLIDICERILIMHEGKVIFNGDVVALINLDEEEILRYVDVPVFLESIRLLKKRGWKFKFKNHPNNYREAAKTIAESIEEKNMCN